MKAETTYYGVEQIHYEFTKDDVLRAITDHFNLPVSKANRIEFDLFEVFEGKPATAELTLRFHRPGDKAEEEG